MVYDLIVHLSPDAIWRRLQEPDGANGSVKTNDPSTIRERLKQMGVIS